MGKSTFESLFEYDRELAEKGARMPYGVNRNGDEIAFFVAKWGNPDHEKMMLRYQKRFQRTRRNKAAETKLTAEIMAHTILKSWENVLDGDGKALDASVENKIEALVTYKELRDMIVEFAIDPVNYMTDDEDAGEEFETEKN